MIFSVFFRWLLLISLTGAMDKIACIGVGINYGQIANNLPPPTQVSSLLQSIDISRVKLYDADPNVLQAFRYSNVEFTIGIGNEYLNDMTDITKATIWLKQHVQPHIPQTKITCITVGNEVLSDNNNTAFKPLLVPAMQNIRAALKSLGLSNQINVTTSHSFTILSNSYPPSAGAFRSDLAEYLNSLLNFHEETNSPFLINAYPFFAYKGNPQQVSLEYVLFKPNDGMTDPGTGLKYDNMLYAQIDSVYFALKAAGHPDLPLRISETGWPSKGGDDEPGATPENAATYNGNLLQRIASNEGTPLRPSSPLDVHVFALFNEDLKPGPVSERNYGLFTPNGSPAYNVGFRRAYSGLEDPLEFDFSASSSLHSQILGSMCMIFVSLISIFL